MMILQSFLILLDFLTTLLMTIIPIHHCLNMILIPLLHCYFDFGMAGCLVSSSRGWNNWKNFFLDSFFDFKCWQLHLLRAHFRFSLYLSVDLWNLHIIFYFSCCLQVSWAYIEEYPLDGRKSYMELIFES